MIAFVDDLVERLPVIIGSTYYSPGRICMMERTAINPWPFSVNLGFDQAR
jgi:hypothetical protein